jgi:hypothetical protein
MLFQGASVVPVNSAVGLLFMNMGKLMRIGSKLLAISLFVAAGSATTTRPQARPVEGPAVIQAVAPIFPIPDKGNIAMGSVIVEVQIDSKGTVTEAKAVQGHPNLYPVSERAAKRWLFAAAPDSRLRTVRLTFVFRVMDVLVPAEDLGPIFSPPCKVEIRSNGRIDTQRQT